MVRAVVLVFVFVFFFKLHKTGGYSHEFNNSGVIIQDEFAGLEMVLCLNDLLGLTTHRRRWKPLEV